jgi:hypothetical protein
MLFILVILVIALSVSLEKNASNSLELTSLRYSYNELFAINTKMFELSQEAISIAKDRVDIDQETKLQLSLHYHLLILNARVKLQ